MISFMTPASCKILPAPGNIAEIEIRGGINIPDINFNSFIRKVSEK